MVFIAFPATFSYPKEGRKEGSNEKGRKPRRVGRKEVKEGRKSRK